MVQEQKIVNTPNRIPLRIKFAKRGNLQYISHLDLMRNFTRYIIRSGLPVWYTEGFHPIPKLTFAMSLSVGAESECEYLDIKLLQMLELSKVKAMLQRVMPNELEILDVYFPDTKFTDIATSEYQLRIHTTGAGTQLCRDITEYVERGPIIILKKTKSGEKEIDIKYRITAFECCYNSESGDICISCRLPADNANFTNPELVIKALKEKFGILSGDMAKEHYSILRTRFLTADNRDFR
jgi:radical SAM-linked protein